MYTFAMCIPVVPGRNLNPAKPVKSYRMQFADGSKKTLQSLQGKVICIVFWHPGMIAEDLPFKLLESVTAQFSADEVAFLAMTTASSRQVHAMITDTGAFDVIVNAGGMLQELDVDSVPAVIVLDQASVFHGAYRGKVNLQPDKIITDIRQLVEEWRN